MLLIQAFLKFSTTGLLIAISLLILRDGLQNRALQFALPLIVSLICLFLTTGHPSISITGTPAIPLRLVDMMSFIFLWWFGLALFNDEFKLGAIELGISLLYIALHLPGRLFYLGFDLPGIPSSIATREVLVSTFSILLMLHLSYVALSGRQEDLIERRRTMRIRFAIAIILMVTVSILMERFSKPLQLDPFLSMFIIYLFTLPISLWAILWLCRLEPDALAFPPKHEITTTIEPRYEYAHQRLVEIMEQEGGYAKHGLTIGKLAKQVGLPSHQLRTMINQSMGYRNYSAFLNHYRIKAVKQALADPEKSRVPVLTLALDAGFSSLAPFNRAFKDSENMTPSEYRNRELTNSTRRDTQQNAH